MATVTGLTAARMLAIEAASVVAGIVSGNNLILTRFDGSTIDAGNVRGPKGDTGDTGPAGVQPPTGCMLPFAGATAPTGWLLCNGAEISRTTYSALFNVISDEWGAGDGSTTFNIPDMTDRAPVGAGVGTLGDVGGTFEIPVEALPAHSHTAGTLSTNTAGNHSHKLNLSTAVGSTGTQVPLGTGTLDRTSSAAVENTGAHSHSVTGSTADSGSGAAYRAPYATVNYIIKT